MNESQRSPTSSLEALDRPAGRSPIAPCISVITVVRNGAATLQNAIESVTRQPASLVEHVVIDGASTDGTVNIIRSHADHIAYWVSEPDSGIYDAMNKGLAAARGDWVIFLGADDELAIPLNAVVENFSDPVAVYYGDVRITTSGAIYGGRFTRYRLMQSNICHQGIFYPRSVYKHETYDLKAGILADHKYNIELWGKKVPFVYLNQVISRFNDKGLSSADPRAFEPIKLAAIREHFGLGYYILKLLRNSAVKLFKAPRGSA